MATAEFRTSPYSASIIESARAAQRKGLALSLLREEQKRRESPSPSMRDIMDEVRVLRASDLVNVLKERQLEKEGGEAFGSSAEVTLVRFPDEEYMEVSQTPVIFSFPYQRIPPLGTGLDLLAAAVSSSDARTALGLIGDPDAVEDEDVDKFVKRTHEEIRVSERRFKVAREAGDLEQMGRLDEIRNLLFERLLNLRADGRTHVPIMCFKLLRDGRSKAAVMTRTDSLELITQYQRFEDLIGAGGGWDGVVEIDQMEHSDLLSALVPLFQSRLTTRRDYGKGGNRTNS